MNVNVDLMEQNLIQINGGITINVDVSVKKFMLYEKGYVWNPAKCNCENGKYLASIIDDSAIIFDDVIESYDEEINSNENKAICKIQSFYILPAFLLITITSLFFYLCFCLLFSNVQSHFLSE